MIRRAPRPTGNFCVISNDVINDRRLSWCSRATLLYLLSKPDHWTVSVANLVNQTCDARKPSGRDAVYANLRDLMVARYIKRVQLRREDGTMAGVEYVVSEIPYEDVEIADDFLLRKPRARRKSAAPKRRSFSAVIETAAEGTDEAAPGGVAMSSNPQAVADMAWSPVDVTPRRISVIAASDDSDAGTDADIDTATGCAPAPQVDGGHQATENTTATPEAFSPLPDRPETGQPDSADTTQVKTHLKKERIGSKNPGTRARRGRPEPKRRSTGQAPDIELFDAATLTARGVDPNVAATWLAVRARKRAVNSMLALDGVQAQADEAGLSLGDAIRMAAESSWQGFRADWVKRSDRTGDKSARRPPRSGAQMTEDELAESLRKAKAELLAEDAAGDANTWLEPTLLHRDGDMWRAPS